jgi:FixJ family two-component response regulator
MPEMDGLEALKRLLELTPNLQVIFLTGYATVQTGVEAVKLGAMDILEKPAQLPKLMESIQRAGAKKVLLVEKQIDEEPRRILQTKAW